MANSRLTVSNRALKKPALNKHPRRRLADPERWYFLLQIPGLWRVMFLVNEDASDERVQTREFAQSLMAGVVSGME
jgi:hypothetical protein